MSARGQSSPVRIAVDIWSDVMCPWCIIGYSQLQQAMANLAGEIAAEVRWRPFELNPDLAPEGEDLASHMQRKYGREPDAAMAGQMERIAAEAGYDMRYLGGDPKPERRLWNTLLAHKLLAWAWDSEGAGAQTRLKLALFDAHFQQRRAMSDPQVLLDIAETAGLDRAGAQAALADPALEAAVRAEEERAFAMGITSVPTMLLEGRFLIPGAQDPGTYAQCLRKVASRLS
jgi:predicted DsbA family dithiol-disulfide isomerase